MTLRPITCPEEVCAAPLDQLTILSATPDFSHEPANLYVVNPDESGDDVYIGELCDPRLLSLVRQVPKLAEFIHFLHTTAVLDPDEDQEWIEFVAELNEQLGL
mgnify:CR=1 FL=1